MAVANAIAYYNATTITIVKYFVIADPKVVVNGSGKHFSLLSTTTITAVIFMIACLRVEVNSSGKHSSLL
jgi:hypothetical protein